jgi:hypothetical protein
LSLRYFRDEFEIFIVSWAKRAVDVAPDSLGRFVEPIAITE